MPKSRLHLAWTWLILAVVAASSAAALFRVGGLPPYEAAGLRLFIAGLVLLPFGIRGLRAGARAERAGLALAAAALAVHFGAWVQSLYLTSVASSVVLVSASPIFVLVLERRQGRRVERGQWLGAAISLAGVALIAGGDYGRVGGRALLGDLLALLAAAAFAVYLRAGRQARITLPVTAYAAPVYTGAGALLLLLQAVLGGAVLHLGPAALWTTALLVLLPTLVGHTGFNFALGEIPSGTVSMLTLLEPLFAILIAWPVLGSLPRPTAVAGGAIALVGLALFQRSSPGDPVETVG